MVTKRTKPPQIVVVDLIGTDDSRKANEGLPPPLGHQDGNEEKQTRGVQFWALIGARENCRNNFTAHTSVGVECRI